MSFWPITWSKVKAKKEFCTSENATDLPDFQIYEIVLMIPEIYNSFHQIKKKLNIHFLTAKNSVNREN